MIRQFASVLVMVLLPYAPGAAAVAEPQHGRDDPQRQARDSRQQDSHRWKWWINPDDRRDLGITDQQSATIDQIFESTMPAQRAKWREFEQLEAALAKTLKESTVDAAQVARQVEKVETMRAQLAQTRTMMLYRINQVLTPDQRTKVEEIRARREQERRKQSDRSQHR